MKATRKTTEVTPAVPAVFEDRVTMEMSLEAAHVLRAIVGNPTAVRSALLKQDFALGLSRGFLVPTVEWERILHDFRSGLHKIGLNECTGYPAP